MAAARFVLCLLGLTAAALAHGGQYRGRVPNLAPPAGGGPPAGSGGPGPTTPGTPNTGVRVEDSGATSWQVWWEFNKDPFLQSRGRIEGGPVSGSDDFYLGVRRVADRIDTLAPTDDDREKRLVPALVKLLDAERNRDVQSAGLVALGKIGRDGPGIDLEHVLSERIARGDQEVRETAVLALGIAGRERAAGRLASLLRDEAAGRQLEERDRVSDRTRAFAAYGLGLLALRSEDAAFDRKVQELLLAVLRDPQQKDRDVLTAVVNGLGILGRSDAEGAHKLLRWQTVDELLEWFGRDLGRGDEVVQAHAPIAIARLLGRGDSAVHQRCKQRFADELVAAQRRSSAILQSSVIALGMLTVPGDGDAPFRQALMRFYEDGHDRLARYLCTIAMGRIGGPAARDWLLRAYDRNGKSYERPWLGLGLGLCAAAGTDSEGGDATIARRLLEDLESTPNRDTQAGLAVAAGLTRHPLVPPVLLRLLRDHEGEEKTAGYLAIALGLCGDRAAVPSLSAILERSTRRPFLLQQTAIALGCLGDRRASEQLATTMLASDSVVVLAALAKAIGQIGDRRSIDPLLAILGDAEASKLTRAFVAAALGGIGDKDLLPWNMPLSVDCNYATGIDTLTNGSTGILDIL